MDNDGRFVFEGTVEQKQRIVGMLRECARRLTLSSRVLSGEATAEEYGLYLVEMVKGKV